jgi:uncharacterized protein YdhG (YjbR/CyaY superfamily)
MKSASPPSKDVDAYIEAFPPDTRAVLARVRRIIRKALPRAEEAISYGMPVYRIDGRYVIYFAGWKTHYSLYPFTDRVEAAVEMEMATHEAGRRRRLGQSQTAARPRRRTSGKGTIRFPLSEPVPASLVTAIVKARANEAAARSIAPADSTRRRTPRARTAR